MPPWLLSTPLQALVLCTAALSVATVLGVWLLLPKGSQLVLQRWPFPLWLYLQAILGLAKLAKPKPKDQATAKQIQVLLPRPVHFSGPRLRAYLALAGFAEGTPGRVPLLYPMVEAFRLVIQAMLLPAFPFNVMGSVLARTRVAALRPLGAEEKLAYSCRVDPAFRTTPKGDTEVDVIVEARSAAAAAAPGQAAGAAAPALAWVATTTVIILSPKRGGPRPAAAAQAPATPALASVLDTWRLGPDTGRRYGLLNGDLNPIHLHALTARLFGFRRPIAHALFLTGRAEASLRNAGLELSYPCALSAEFKRPTLLPATLHCGWVGAASAAEAAAAARSAGGLRFAVVTEDRAKEVLVGSITCEPVAARAAAGL